MQQYNLFSAIAEVSPIFQPHQAPAQRNPLKPKDRADIYSLVYSNGQNNPARIVFHSDGGHGWLQVPHSLIKRLGIGAKITGYSYRDTNFAYLEEECDYSTFLHAMQIPESGLMKDFNEIVPEEYKDDSPIRRKNHYR